MWQTILQHLYKQYKPCLQDVSMAEANNAYSMQVICMCFFLKNASCATAQGALYCRGHHQKAPIHRFTPVEFILLSLHFSLIPP